MNLEDMDWLLSLNVRGMVLGLGNMDALLKRMGNPERAFKSIHVAGTDGKGSTCAILHSILKASGIRTGLYTSPHIMRLNERIVIDGEVTDDEMRALAKIVREHAEALETEGMECTFFEVMTAMAFLHFQRNRVEYAIVETGLGGRYDATNVIVPEVSVITHIGMEHTAVLGDTIEKIAYEKAGIIKPGIPVITANGPPALNVINDVAEKMDSKLIVANTGIIRDVKLTDSGVFMNADEYFVSIPGRHQAENAIVAVTALRNIDVRKRIEDHIKEGLSNVCLKGRMQRTGRFMVDVTHTSEGIRGIASDIMELHGKVDVIIGLLEDKDADGIMDAISTVAKSVTVVPLRSERTFDPDELAEIAKRYNSNVTTKGSVADAMDRCNSEGLILVTGSFHMAEEATEWLRTYAGY